MRTVSRAVIWLFLDIPAILGGVFWKEEAPSDSYDRVIEYSNPSDVEFDFKTIFWLRGRRFSRMCQERLPAGAELISVGGLFMVGFSLSLQLWYFALNKTLCPSEAARGNRGEFFLALCDLLLSCSGSSLLFPAMVRFPTAVPDLGSAQPCRHVSVWSTRRCVWSTSLH